MGKKLSDNRKSEFQLSPDIRNNQPRLNRTVSRETFVFIILQQLAKSLWQRPPDGGDAASASFFEPPVEGET